MKPLFFFILFVTCNRAWADDSLICTGKSDEAGRKHGVWLCKTQKGKLVKKERYKHGELSTWILYNNKGQMIQSRNKKGRIHKYKPCGC
jgi:hypothetical protein